MYAVSAVVSAFVFFLWRRVDDELKPLVWRRYGWFSALAFVGRVGGLVTAVADMRYRYNCQIIAKAFEHGDPCSKLRPDFFAVLDCYKPLAVTLTSTNYWLAVSPVPYAIEFLCHCCATLLVRARSCFRSQSSRPVLQPRPNRDQVIERMVEFVVNGAAVRRPLGHLFAPHYCCLR